MMKKPLLLASLLLPLAACATAPVAPVAQSAPAASSGSSADRFRAHVEFLADDALEGREAGTRGFDIAANYVATQMSSLGLAPGDIDGDYMQDISFANYTVAKDPAPAFLLDGKRVAQGDGVIVGRLEGHSGTRAEPAPMVFVGSGIHAPQYGIDDYAGVDARGKVVVLYGSPSADAFDGLPSEVASVMGGSVAEMAVEQGAVGIINILPEAVFARFPWTEFTQTTYRPSLVTLNPDGSALTETHGMRIAGIVRDQSAPMLFDKASLRWQSVRDRINKGERVAAFDLGKSIGMERTIVSEPAFSSANVIGMIEGSDPVLKNEVVMLTAHLDHVGMRDDHGGGGGQFPSKTEGDDDVIYNGALDNAAGIASLLEAAEAFRASGKAPRRTVMFVALTAEEKGLMGAEWLARNPAMLGGREIVGLVNLDMPVILSDFDRVVAFGAQHSTMGAAVEDAISSLGVSRIEDPMPEENFFIRSDHYAFVKAGVPSVYLDPAAVPSAEGVVEDFLENHYHRPSDDLSLPIDWNAGAKFSLVNYRIARTIADTDERPRWYADSYFGTRFAPQAPKATR
ncbi:M20/M25/M40 family metallo-hydrolase [Sphingomicrobium sp. XHP0235]|uniref:M20/M25/M40 family metallo-hydrolase n=1 Tax=Sphingomicrobium aquimarinum TaxID=3133971 RepID=UPI0031FF2CA0